MAEEKQGLGARWTRTFLFNLNSIGTIIKLLVPATVVGVIAGWAAWATEILGQYAPLSWVAATLLGATIAVGFLSLYAFARKKFAESAAIARWSEKVDAVNPLDTAFNNKRISVSDLANPITRRISGKKFTECELVGPANLVLLNNIRVFGVGFGECDVVVGRDNVYIANAIAAEDIQVVGGMIYRCTIIIPPNLVSTFSAMPGVTFLTLTGDPEIDARPNVPRRRIDDPQKGS